MKNYMYKRFLLLLLFLFVLMNCAVSQNYEATPVTIEESYVIPSDKNRIEAEKILLGRARKKAIEKVVGIRVQVADVMMTTESGKNVFETYQQLMRNVVNGRIVDEQTPDYYTDSEGTLFIRYACKVAEVKGEQDPGFSLQITSNKKVFSVGEELLMTVQSTKEAYITIFSITEDNRVSVLFPNIYMTENKVGEREVRKIPNEKEREVISFTMQKHPINPNQNYSELLFIVATKSNMTYQKLQHRLDYESNWIALNQWLLNIPRDQWTEAYLQYQVFPK